MNIVRRKTRVLARMSTTEDVNIKSSAEVFEDWLDWPGGPFPWQKCDSPIEDFMFHEFYKFAGDQVVLRRQYDVKTDAGTFRLDFLLTHRTTGRPIGIECDGRDYHSAARDRMRDEAIIRSGALAEIYRVRGKDCNYCGRDVLQLLAQCEPWIVSERFHQQAAFYPHPTTYRDERVGMIDGYSGIARTYFEQVDDEYEEVNCECEGECECVPIPVVRESTRRTPTLVRYMSGEGFPSAFERPAYLKPVPMPAWKDRLRELWEEHKRNE